MSHFRLLQPFLFLSLTPFIICSASPVIADVHENKVVEKPRIDQKALAGRFPTYADKWALVIGIDEFQDTTWNLKYGSKDAKDFARYLEEYANFGPGNIKLIAKKKVSQSEIADGLRWLSKVCTKDDLAVVYIRSRGTFKPPGKSQTNYLAASDTDPLSPEKSAIKIGCLVPELSSSVHMKSLATIIDTDFAGAPCCNEISPVGDTTNGKPDPTLILFSCGENEVSIESKRYENSVFTHALITALKKDGKTEPLGKLGYATRQAVNDELEAAGINMRQRVNSCGSSRKMQTDILISSPALDPRAVPVR